MIVYDKRAMTDVAEVGGKGVGLAKLIAYGFTVPDFFVVTAGTDLYEKDFAAELDCFAANLNCQEFAVRSSSVNEDGKNDSFAGQYSTKLNVKRQDLLEAVREVAFSCRNSHVKKYAQHAEKSGRNIAVVVQKQLSGDFSGVMFTTSPYNPDERTIECVSGAGERLVGGAVIPKERTFKKTSPPKEGFYNSLAIAAAALEKAEGMPLDIEWTFADNYLWFLQMRPLTALGDALPQIPQREWNLYVYRDFCLFAHGVQRIASSPAVQAQTFGFSVPISEGLLVCGREFYSPQSDALADEAWASLDKERFFDDFIKKIKNSVRNTRRRANALKNRNCDELGISELFKLYRREIKEYIKSYVPLMLRPDDYLYNRLVGLAGEDRAEVIVNAASTVNKKTYYSAERGNFLRSVISGNAAAYIDEYEWTCGPLGKVAEALTEERYLMRAEGLTAELAAKKLKEIKAVHRKADCERQAVIESLNEKEKKLFELISEFIFLRTYTAENSDRYFYYIRKRILGNICKRLDIPEDILPLMSPEEVCAAEGGFRITGREIAKRKSGETVVIANGESSVYYTGQSYALLKKLLPKDCGKDAVLSGKIACMGEVRAKVKIVNNLSQAEQFDEGYILVTTMTVPEISAALDKACGIITDEGGITCHAAIIAREYAIPCLVGTKIATSVLKDGMIVKLDCINGRVEIES